MMFDKIYRCIGIVIDLVGYNVIKIMRLKLNKIFLLYVDGILYVIL